MCCTVAEYPLTWVHLGFAHQNHRETGRKGAVTEMEKFGTRRGLCKTRDKVVRWESGTEGRVIKMRKFARCCLPGAGTHQQKPHQNSSSVLTRRFVKEC